MPHRRRSRPRWRDCRKKLQGSSRLRYRERLRAWHAAVRRFSSQSRRIILASPSVWPRGRGHLPANRAAATAVSSVLSPRGREHHQNSQAAVVLRSGITQAVPSVLSKSKTTSVQFATIVSWPRSCVRMGSASDGHPATRHIGV